jgi:hypothetical protein
VSRITHLRNVERSARELVLTANHRHGDPHVQSDIFFDLVRALMDARQDQHITALAQELERRSDGISAA